MSSSKLAVLVVGQTPPPVHGQAIAIRMLLDGTYESIELSHVPMDFSRTVQEIGQLGARKLGRLPLLVARILWARIRSGARVLYYPPYCNERAPFVRDVVVLVCVRWAFPSTVFHFHSIGLTEVYENLGRMGRVAFRKAYSHPDVAIVLSNVSRADVQLLMPKHVAVVPNGIPDDAGHGAAASAERHDAVVLFVGVVRETKGVLVLLDACAQLRQQGVPFQLELMGDVQPQEFAPQLLRRIEELGLSSSVQLLGSRTGEEKWSAFRHADVFCLPTLFDNFPLVVLEAMEFGLPVVASRCGSMGEIVVDDETGFLVVAGDAAAVAERLGRLLSSPELRRSMGAAARRRYEAQFTVERYRQGLEAALCLA